MGIGDPSTDGGSRLLGDLELDWSSGFPLNDHCPVADNTGKRDISDHYGDQVTTSQLAVDREIEERQISFESDTCSRVRMLRTPCGLRGGFCPTKWLLFELGMVSLPCRPSAAAALPASQRMIAQRSLATPSIKAKWSLASGVAT
jgi:hypothetical protein